MTKESRTRTETTTSPPLAQLKLGIQESYQSNLRCVSSQNWGPNAPMRDRPGSPTACWWYVQLGCSYWGLLSRDHWLRRRPPLQCPNSSCSSGRRRGLTGVWITLLGGGTAAPLTLPSVTYPQSHLGEVGGGGGGGSCLAEGSSLGSRVRMRDRLNAGVLEYGEQRGAGEKFVKGAGG